MRQRLCAPGPRQAVWELGQLPAALDTRAVASERSQPAGLVCPLPQGHRQTDTLLKLPQLPLSQKFCRAQTMSFFQPSVLLGEHLDSIFKKLAFTGHLPCAKHYVECFMCSVLQRVVLTADPLDRHDHPQSTDAETEAWNVLVT